MNTKVQKWGYSRADYQNVGKRPAARRLGVPPIRAYQQNGSAPNSVAEANVVEGSLIVEPTRGPHYDLDDLLSGIDSASLHGEMGTGPGVGRETW